MAYNGLNYIQSGQAFSTGSSADLVFSDMFGANEWVRITSSGYLGLGLSNPVRPLHIKSADCRIRLEEVGETIDVELTNGGGDAILTTNGTSNVRLQTNNTERLRITSDGEVLINETSARSYVDGNNVTQTPKLQVEADDNTSSAMVLRYNSGAGSAARRASFIFARTADGSAVSDSSVLGEVLFMGEGNNTLEKSSSIRAEVEGTPGTNAMPGRLILSTSGGGSDSPTERLRITSGGLVLIGTGSNRTINSHIPRVQVTGTTYGHSTVSIINNEANGNGAYLFLAKQRSGSIGGSTAVQANDIIGQIRFNAGDGTDLENYAAVIEAKAQVNASSNSTPGMLDFYTTRQNGASAHKMRMAQNSNHSHVFSIGTNSTHFNNASTPDRTSVKVGASIHIDSTFGHNANSGMYYNCYSGGNDKFYRGTNNPSGGDWRAAAQTMRFGSHYFYGDPSSSTYSAQAEITTMQLNMQIFREGYVTKPNNPGFCQRSMTGSTFDDGTLKGGTSDFNIGSHYNTSTGIFTAPVTGRYLISCGVLVETGTGRLEGKIYKNNSSNIANFNGTGTTYDGPTCTIIVQLSTNDNIRVKRISGNAYNSSHDNNYFCAYLLG